MEDSYEKRGYLLEDFRLFHLKDDRGTDVGYHYHEFHKLVFLLSGSEDPVGNYGKGVQEVCKKLLRYGKNAQMKLYPNCRHEVLNDTCRDEAIRDILVFAER